MVNGVSFRAGVFDNIDINKPQSYQRPVAPKTVTVDSPKKSKGSSFGKILGGVLITAALAAGALVLGKNTGIFSKISEKAGKLADGKFKFLENPTKTAMSALNTAGEWISTKGKAVYDYGKNLLSKKGTSAAA